MQYQQQDAKVTPKASAGKLLGAKVDWQAWDLAGSFHIEAMTKLPGGEDMVHAFCSASSAAALVEPRKLIETLRKK